MFFLLLYIPEIVLLHFILETKYTLLAVSTDGHIWWSLQSLGHTVVHNRGGQYEQSVIK